MNEVLACDGCHLTLPEVRVIATVLGLIPLCQTCQLQYIGLLHEMCEYHARHGRLPTEAELNAVCCA